MPQIPPTATGSNNRVRMRRADQTVTCNGTMIAFDPPTGNFSLLMDYQPEGAAPIAFTRGTKNNEYSDPQGLAWICIG